jgi:hypothetical protein
MELNRIKQLLEKYYEGSTSLEEEQLLKDFFRYHPVPAELEADKELFLFTASEANVHPLNSPLEQRLTNWIDLQDVKTNRKIKLIWVYRVTGIAATFAIVLTCYLMYVQPKNKVAIKDTYTNPEVAYAEAKRALLYVSEQLNKGTAPLGQVGKLNKEMNRLSTISSFNDGLEQLKMVSKYYNTSKSENNKTK